METARVNVNLRSRADGSVTCAHCGHQLPGDAWTYLSLAPMHQGPPGEAGPHICNDPQVYIDAQIVFRQYYCPGCWTALHTEVVPA
jgi:N-methylhydantoinase B